MLVLVLRPSFIVFVEVSVERLSWSYMSCLGVDADPDIGLAHESVRVGWFHRRRIKQEYEHGSTQPAVFVQLDFFSRLPATQR